LYFKSGLVQSVHRHKCLHLKRTPALSWHVLAVRVSNFRWIGSSLLSHSVFSLESCRKCFQGMTGFKLDLYLTILIEVITLFLLTFLKPTLMTIFSQLTSKTRKWCLIKGNICKQSFSIPLNGMFQE
jgi:hypothetical protein